VISVLSGTCLFLIPEMSHFIRLQLHRQKEVIDGVTNSSLKDTSLFCGERSERKIILTFLFSGVRKIRKVVYSIIMIVKSRLFSLLFSCIEAKK
jgi:hypothetical protein